jgi:isoamylase
LALGVPMLLMGDEVRRTQHGNNNAYCQDNETSWFDWSLVEKNSGLLDFVRKLIRFRLDLPVREENAITLSELLHQTKIDWHGTRLFEPDWSRDSHVLCFTLHGQKNLFHFIYNAYWQSLEFELPSKNGIGTRSWKKMIDTSVESPHDFCDLESACLIRDATQRVPDRTIVVLTCSVE